MCEDVFGESYACMEQGLCYDDVNDKGNALLMYERGLNLLREGEMMEGAKESELYKYLKEAEHSCSHRINVLKKEGAGTSLSKTPEMGEHSKSDDVKQIFSKLDSVGEAEAELILCIPDGIQLFSIEGDSTTAPTYPTALSIFKFPPGPDQAARGFIQVGPWNYPLFKHTPILRNEFGTFVVPNPTEEHPTMSVAIMLPMDVDPQLAKDLRAIFDEFSTLMDSKEDHFTPEEKKKISERIAMFLIRGGEKAAWIVQKTTAKTASMVHHRSEKYRSGLVPTEKPTVVSPVVKGGAVFLHKGGKVVAKCTRYLLDRIGDIGVAVGRQVAAGAKNSVGEGTAGGLVSGTFTVLGGGISCVSTVWISLEEASKTLCRSIAEQTVQNVKIKYGEEAGETTHHALHGVGHSTLAATQLWDLGPRSIAGRMARKAGVQVVRDLEPSTSKCPHKKKL